jgi:hypothetical protein
VHCDIRVMIAHVLEILRSDDKQDPRATEVKFVEPHNPRYDEMKGRYGDWWGYSNRLSMLLPFSALDKAIDENLLVCPICEGVFSKNSALLCHLSKGIIDAVRQNTPLDIKRLSAGSHSFVDARILRNNGESLANALGLSNVDDIGVIEHLKGFPVSNLENLNEIMQHGDWKTVWNRFLRKGLGEFRLKQSLEGKRGFYAHRYGYKDVEIEWNYYLRPRTKVNVHEADVMVFHKNTEGKMVLFVPWEAKLHASIRSAVWMYSMANIVYSVILTCGFISGYGLMVTKHLNTKAFTAYLSNHGKGRIIEMADGGIVNINGTSEESRYDLSFKVREPHGTEIFSRIIDFWIEEYDSSNYEVITYIKDLLWTIENKLKDGKKTKIPGLQSTQTRRLTRCAPKKNYGRYDEIMTIVEKFTRSGQLWMVYNGTATLYE